MKRKLYMKLTRDSPWTVTHITNVYTKKSALGPVKNKFKPGLTRACIMCSYVCTSRLHMSSISRPRSNPNKGNTMEDEQVITQPN